MIVAHAGEQQYQSRSVQVHFLQNVEASFTGKVWKILWAMAYDYFIKSLAFSLLAILLLEKVFGTGIVAYYSYR